MSTSTRRKFYVVWQGLSPGIYDTWDECRAQVEGVNGSRYKAFNSIEEATAAFRGSYEDQATLLLAMARRQPVITDFSTMPEIRTDAIAVDGACASNPGPMEYRAVEVATGREIFHMGPLPGGTNNIGEYLALIHALALLHRQGDHTTPVYSDSVTAQSWLRRRHSNTKIERTAANVQVFDLLERADRWIATHRPMNPVLKWDTERWGEIPADFGRK